jgi:hypothetical protein
MCSLAATDSLAALYQTGVTWDQFFAAAKARKETWRDNYDRGAPDQTAADRAKAVGGSWRILAVAEDWCGDSANSVPYLARLVEQVPSLELRIVNSKAGRWVMERYRTPDGRAATPTIVILDGEGNPVGCLVERSAKLRAWVSEEKPKLSDDQFQEKKLAWYQEDRGRATVDEIVELLELAAAGTPRCPRG